jgi:hypothetical protein
MNSLLGVVYKGGDGSTGTTIAKATLVSLSFLPNDDGDFGPVTVSFYRGTAARPNTRE